MKSFLNELIENFLILFAIAGVLGGILMLTKVLPLLGLLLMIVFATLMTVLLPRLLK